MPINVPETGPITYPRNFLQSVLCQIRVSPIFKIASDLPSEFQEAIRRDYPHVQTRPSVEIKLGEEVLITPEKLGKAWRFLSDNEDWTVTLDARFLALETRKYTNFDDFLTRLRKVHDHYVNIYKPSRAERVGLRYVNVISPPEKLSAPAEWRSWINPELIGFPGTDRVSFPLTECIQVIGTRQEPGHITVRHGFGADPIGNTVYIIDVDRFADSPTAQEGVSALVANFNDACHHFFQWAIAKSTKDWMSEDA